MTYTFVESPMGPILLTSDGVSLVEVSLGSGRRPLEIPPDGVADDDVPPFPEARRQLAAYFAGTLTRFDLPLAPRGTAFQQLVWRELIGIPFGTTVSYGEIARRIGNPAACRAVGLANGSNPLAIVVPCHRVIGANGKLTGYAGGLPRKQALLALEAGIRTPVPPTLDLTGDDGAC